MILRAQSGSQSPRPLLHRSTHLLQLRSTNRWVDNFSHDKASIDQYEGIIAVDQVSKFNISITSRQFIKYKSVILAIYIDHVRRYSIGHDKAILDQV